VLNVLETGVVSSQHQTERLDAATQRVPTDLGDKRAVVFPSGLLLQDKQPKTLVANEHYHVVIATKIRVKRTFEDGRGIWGIYCFEYECDYLKLSNIGAGCCEDGDEHLLSIKVQEFLE
jgi:hypothetical protein